MKKLLSLILTALLLLGLIGCRQQELPVQTWPTTAETSGVPDSTAPPETTVPATDPPETEPIQSTQLSETASQPEATEEPEPTQAASEPTAPPSKKPAETHPPETNPTEPPVTQPTETEPPETDPPEAEPVESLPPATEPPATEPPSTRPTEPAPTEPAGCRHDWICIQHAEEGHWQAGIACDCGWVAYGNPDDLVALWNTHSASYPAAESLFNHGGYGSVDEWIVDKPAYDEWVCRHCGEPKP